MSKRPAKNRALPLPGWTDPKGVAAPQFMVQPPRAMNILCLDFGSSSIKAATVSNGRIVGPVGQATYPISYDGTRAEVDPRAVLKGLAAAIAQLGASARKADTIAMASMGASWLAMDAQGRPLTPIVTDDDRRSIEVAADLEKRVGKARYLKLAGWKPVPGRMSCTTWLWFLRNEPAAMKNADLCGHLSTFIHRTLTKARVTDPSNAACMGFYNALTLDGWNDDLIAAAGIQTRRLPQVIGAEEISGFVTRSAASRFGLTQGTPMLAGCMGASAVMLLAGNEPGQVVDVCGGTDVLAMCTDKPRPHELLLTQPVGVGKRWISVSTRAAGSILDWAHRNLFADLDEKAFARLVASMGRKAAPPKLAFSNEISGLRTDVNQGTTAFSGMTLSTRREDLLAAIVDSMAASSARRMGLLREVNRTPGKARVLTSGRMMRQLSPILHRDWPGKWQFGQEENAVLRGVAALVP